MPEDNLNEREFELINIIGAKIGSNQRDLSRYLDLSLGMTNMLIRRLVTKGYIRIRQLNKRKAEYLLTPKGFTEKMRKSVKYTIKTISSIGMIRERLKKILTQLYEKGERHFYILGGSDLVVLVEMTLKETCSDHYTVTHLKDLSSEKINGTLLICKEGFKNGKNHAGKSVNLLEELAKDTTLYQKVETKEKTTNN